MRVDGKLFLRALTVIMIIEACFLLTGCGDWESQAIQVISLLNPAIVAILNILAALGVSVAPSFMTKFNDWAAQTQAALGEVKDLIAQYKAAAAQDQPSILSRIQLVLKTAQDNLQAILPELHITNPTNQARIAAALAAIGGFVLSIQNLLPAVTKAKSRTEAFAVHTEAQTAVKTFKEEFNRNVEPFGEEYKLN